MPSWRIQAVYSFTRLMIAHPCPEEQPQQER